MGFIEGETVVAIGATDGYRYVGVTPPLTTEEIHTMEWAGVLDVDDPIRRIVEFEPHCSLVTVSGDADLISPAERDEKAKGIAAKIAYALGQSREGNIRSELTLVGLVGYNSSPFNPDTDSLRR